MRRAATLAAATAAVLTTALGLAAGTAAAATTDTRPTAEIVSAERTNTGFDVVFQATNLPPGARIERRSVRVTADGVPVPDARATRITARNLARTAVLAIDTSQSMGAGLEAAKGAATTYAQGLPGDVRLGLVSFDALTHVLVQPTRNHAQTVAAIQTLELGPRTGTRLFDAARVAVGMAGGSGSGDVLLITDGKDSGSVSSKEDAIATVSASGVGLDAVYIGPAPVPQDLEDLVHGADEDGRVVSADPTELASIYERAARNIRNQVRVVVPTPPRLVGQSVSLGVSARAGDLVLRDVTQVTFGAAVPKPVRPRAAGPGLAARLTPPAVLPVALGLLFLGLFVLVGFALTEGSGAGSEQTRLRRRLSLYTLTGRQAVPAERPTTVLGRSSVARGAVDLAGRVVSQRDVEAALGKRLEAAGLPLRPAEWVLIHLGVTLGLGLFMLLVTGGNPVPALLGLFLGAVAPWLYLSWAESRRTSAFMGQLPETLQMVSGSLSAGYSLAQALDTVVREGQQPMTAEFNRALVETRLGVPIEDALEGVASRMHSKDFAWVVMAYRIQREVGGNLAELLATLAETMRERDALRRQVRALSAEGRLSGWILGLLPPVFAIYLLTTRPEYLRPLVTDPLGILLVSLGVVLLIIGALWMRKAVKVEV